jgi:hypothetical protein
LQGEKQNRKENIEEGWVGGGGFGCG